MSEHDQEYVVLCSNDGFQFVVRKSAAKVSKAIRSMLDKRSEFFIIHIYLTTSWSASKPILTLIIDNFAEARENKIVFHNMKYYLSHSLTVSTPK